MALIRLANGSYRRTGPRRRHHHGGARVRQVMPARPRKPPTGYNLFIRTFYQDILQTTTHICPSNESLRLAARYWRADSFVPQHTVYKAQAREQAAAYRRNLVEWKRRVKVIKRPGNAYILFSCDLWQRQREGRSAMEFGRYAGQRWRGMDPSQRSPWIMAARRARTEHRDKIDSLISNRTQIDDYLNPEVNPVDTAAEPGAVAIAH